MRRSGGDPSLIGVADTSTHTRYRKVCLAVQHLLATRQLMALDWLRLCLPQNFSALVTETAPHVLYMETIRRLVRTRFEPDQAIDAMAVIDVWRTDQHISENLKKMAVRGAFPQLVRESLLRRERFGVFRAVGVDNS
jgi:Arc/MetJ family transcription regulator